MIELGSPNISLVTLASTTSFFWWYVGGAIILILLAILLFLFIKVKKHRFAITVSILCVISIIGLGVALLLNNHSEASTTTAAAQNTPANVLVVANSNNAQSIALADYYIAKRKVPAANKLLVSWTATDNAEVATKAQYNAMSKIILTKAASRPNINYILLVRNLPSKISGGGSVDSALAGGNGGARMNPYYWHTEAFSSKKLTMTYSTGKVPMYLVTRLDGLTWADSQALVDRSLAATKGGTIFMDSDPAKKGGFLRFNNMITAAAAYLTKKSIPDQVNTAASFINPGYAMAGYASWGSNDSRYNAANYSALTFKPGAIAETAVSTSARSLRTSPSGQSLINVLIKNGVTGVKGYVAEPFLTAIADPSIMFARYTSGRNLAESFYSASMYVGWQDVIIGDPLCSPYSTN